MYFTNNITIIPVILNFNSSLNISFAFIIFFFIILVIIFILNLISFLISFFNFKRTSDKISVYECGFLPFEDTRHIISISFFHIGLLFLLFDIEIIFLFPIISIFYFFDFFYFYILLDFIIELLIAYILLLKYEFFNKIKNI